MELLRLELKNKFCDVSNLNKESNIFNRKHYLNNFHSLHFLNCSNTYLEMLKQGNLKVDIILVNYILYYPMFQCDQMVIQSEKLSYVK